MQKSYGMIDGDVFSESISMPISNSENPFPELAKWVTKNKLENRLVEFRENDWVGIVFYAKKSERDLAFEHGCDGDYNHLFESGVDFAEAIQKHIPTTVIFRRFKDGEIIALFPYEIEDWNGAVISYMHIGQHSAATLGLIDTTKLATPDQYADLQKELESIGYVLDIRKRVNWRRWNEARKAI